MTYVCSAEGYDGERRVGGRLCGMRHADREAAERHLADILRRIKRDGAERQTRRYVYAVVELA